MAFLPIGKTSKPRQFDYKPIYYDARKERLEAVVARAKQKAGMLDESDGHFSEERLRLSLREARSSLSRGAALRQSKKTFGIVMLLALILLFYFWL